MSEIAVQSLPKLPLRGAISLAYAWFFQKFADVLRVSWLWLVLGGVLMGGVNWLQWSWMAAAIADAANSQAHREQPQIALPSGYGWLMLLAYLVFMLGTTSIAVAWHRRIILGEQPGLSGDNIATTALWRYVGICVVFGLMCYLPILLASAPVLLILGLVAPGYQPSGVAITSAVLILLVFYIVAISIVLRLSVLLPARAVGDLALTFRQAWRRTRGNTWRMFWGLIACSLPPMIVLEIISLIVVSAIGLPKFVPGNGQVAVPALGLTIMSTFMFVITLLIVPIYIGFLSQCYRHFFQSDI